MARKVTAQELLNLKASGATITGKDKKVTVDGLTDLVYQMQDMIRAYREESQAHQAAMQMALQAIAEKLDGSNVDIEPIKTILTQVAVNTMPAARPSYEFTIERTPRGMLKSIKATPSETIQ